MFLGKIKALSVFNKRNHLLLNQFLVHIRIKRRYAKWTLANPATSYDHIIGDL